MAAPRPAADIPGGQSPRDSQKLETGRALMNKESTDEPSSTATYLLLFAVQMFGAGFVIWASLPAFKQLLLNPGKQHVSVPYDSYAVVAVLFMMQGSHWYRYTRINSLPKTTVDPQPCLPVSRSPEFYIRKCAFLDRTVPASPGTPFGCRHLPLGAPGSIADLFAVRTVLLHARARAAKRRPGGRSSELGDSPQ